MNDRANRSQEHADHRPIVTPVTQLVTVCLLMQPNVALKEKLMW